MGDIYQNADILADKHSLSLADRPLPDENLCLELCCEPPFGCGGFFHRDEFSHSGRNICNACWASKGLSAQLHRKELKAKKLMEQIAAYAGRRSKHKRPPHIFTQTSELMAEFGNVQGFAQTYKRVFDNAEKKGSLGIAAKLLMGISWMLAKCSDIEEHQEDVLAMNAEQLQEEKLSVIAELLAQNGLTITVADETVNEEDDPSSSECA